MDLNVAAKVVALRPALEALIVKATTNPEGIAEPEQEDSELMNAVRRLSKVNSGRFGLANEESG